MDALLEGIMDTAVNGRHMTRMTAMSITSILYAMVKPYNF